jgi:hypothetical protein
MFLKMPINFNMVTANRRGKTIVSSVPTSVVSGKAKTFGGYPAGFYWMLGLVIGVLIPVEILGCKTLHIGGLVHIADSWLGVLMLSGCVAYVRWRPLPRLVHSTELALAALLIWNALSILVQIAGRSPYPLVDDRLAALDASVGFHTEYFVRLLSELPVVRETFALVYATLPILVIAAIIAPSIVRCAGRSQRFVVAVILAVVMTAFVFWRWPAVGPWTAEAYAPTMVQSGAADYLFRLRSNLPVLVDMNNAGIVSLPSFHVVLAVLSAHTLSFTRLLRPFAWALCALICLSTITTGWHYGVDVLAGLLVAATSIVIAAWIIPRESTQNFDTQSHISLVRLDDHEQNGKAGSIVYPQRISGCLRTHSVIELPAGTVHGTKTIKGDILALDPVLQNCADKLNYGGSKQLC